MNLETDAQTLTELLRRLLSDLHLLGFNSRMQTLLAGHILAVLDLIPRVWPEERDEP